MLHILSKYHKTVMAIMAVLFVFISSCKQQDENAAIINIKNPPVNQPVKLMVLDTTGFRSVDSMSAKSVQEQFTLSIPHPLICFVQSGERRVEFIATAGDTVMVDLQQNTSEVAATTDNHNYQKLIKIIDNANAIADSLSYVFIKAQPTDSFAMVREKVNDYFSGLMDGVKEQAIDYISSNPSSVGIFRAVNSYVKQTPVFNYAIDHQWFHVVDSMLMANHPTHPYTLSFHYRVNQLAVKSGYTGNKGRGIEPGSKFPEVELMDINKKMKKIEPSSKGITLIYLWDHTTRSRKSNVQLKQLYENFKEQELKIYGIGFDENYKRWSSTIVLDKMWWNNLIETSGYSSPLLKELNNPSLPYIIAIDNKSNVSAAFYNVAQAGEWLKEQNKKKN